MKNIKEKDPRNQMIFYGIIFYVVGGIIVSFTNKIGTLALGLNIFGSLFVGTGLVFKIPYIARWGNKK